MTKSKTLKFKTAERTVSAYYDRLNRSFIRLSRWLPYFRDQKPTWIKSRIII